MSAHKLPIEFKSDTATEQGDGVLIHWTKQRPAGHHRAVVVCASVESTRTVKRMTQYLREEER